MDKQEQILQAALKLFVEYGFHGTPTSKIAQSAGVSNGTLFHYYKTKDELVVAVYIYIKEHLASCTHLLPQEEMTLRQYFKQLYMAWLKWALSHPCEYQFTRQFVTSPYLMKVSQGVREKYSAPLLDCLKQAIDGRVVKPLPLSLLLSLISSHIDGVYLYLESSDLDETQRDELVNRTFDLMWDMIG
ncbi:TetR family transcriptional regulator [Breznakibacter xylanolyticus]|uniref:TetR family transcriptional regulator n=1 Tax=Breznakibacter xylanolyticus TaxID=990 RepID=A0A2W7NKL9_9BACT|nr:TetR/AcrR family transcriptional regulator [Breznakibacter xylanolyticus]MBN2742805.1 TetR/AcrR family transcriptional regulator [Marinilabiliaceae bacterium]PZX20410.1 TetR family transcriptional regulator [Breznakibacter xylanolyticus]